MYIQYLYDAIAVLCARINSLDNENKSQMYRSYWSNLVGNTKKIYY